MRTHQLALLGCVVLSACRADYETSADTGYYGDWGTDTGTDSGGAPAGDNDGAVGSEVESDFLSLSPAQTDQYVFVANATRDTLTRIEVDTRDVRTVPVGRKPAQVLASGDGSQAIVFNELGESVSFVDAETLEVDTVGVRAKLNRMKQSPDGAWLALWHDQSMPGGSSGGGLQSFNEVSFVDVFSHEHTAMAVGFNPKAVEFTPDGTTAAVLTDDSLAVVDLTATSPRPVLVPLTTGAGDPLIAEELMLSPDGAWAFVRQRGVMQLVVVDLSTLERTDLPLSSEATDLDLSPDGTMLTVMCREAEELWSLDMTDPVGIVPTITPLPAGMSFGSLLFLPGGDTAAVYTTASPVARYALWNVATGELDVRALVKPIRILTASPDGETLLAFHPNTDAPDADPNSPFKGHFAVTVIDRLGGRTNPLLLPSEPRGYAHDPSGERGYFILYNRTDLDVVDYRSLLHDELRLASAPVYVGAMPPGAGGEARVWASQEHPLGRLSFIDPVAGSVETITGFELNSAIED